ncbi:phosphate transport system regulatory protein PhoU [Candidatus Velamenicoccus archaeovorus]|jgi:phosphate uptake regulator|uniref:Phosphate transport system regulatory protein PhoU n=1 Tax=Velamenicoccus archaeovorus TaxID=1930593 RepID=A0A410P3G0_VELA1|nr:PhoU domain-containing protein [Candidatus Velamenicoccus archaeovorus]QAT16737.1 phosphate transport system regulatory protein PhoU [Candidatus Velamenicoccus archaeovorus]
MNILVWLLRNYWMNTEDVLMIAIEKELRKLNDDLLQICRLTQEAIRNISGVLMRFDAENTQEIIDNNKKIRVLCVAYEEYFTNIVRQYHPEDSVLKFISSSINISSELKQITDLTAGIAESLLSLNTNIPDKDKINISQFAIIFQNIVWDSVISFLKQDTALAKKTVLTSLTLKKICSRRQDELIETNKTAESTVRGETVLLFIIQSVRDIATHTVNIAKI